MNQDDAGSLIVHCQTCGETWDMDMDPTACTCDDGEWALGPLLASPTTDTEA